MRATVRMQRWALVASLCLVTVAMLLLAHASGVEAPSGDPTVNTAVCTASNTR